MTGGISKGKHHSRNKRRREKLKTIRTEAKASAARISELEAELKLEKTKNEKLQAELEKQAPATARQAKDAGVQVKLFKYGTHLSKKEYDYMLARLHGTEPTGAEPKPYQKVAVTNRRWPKCDYCKANDRFLKKIAHSTEEVVLQVSSRTHMINPKCGDAYWHEEFQVCYLHDPEVDFIYLLRDDYRDPDYEGDSATTGSDSEWSIG